MEIQGLPLLNIKPNKLPSRTKAEKNTSASDTKNAKSPRMGGEQSQSTEVLISVSSTVADSKGIDRSDNSLAFSVDEETGETVINIIDNTTGDVIKQIPPDEILRLKKRMGEIQGLLLDRKV